MADENIRVFLGRPGYGEEPAGAGRGLYKASRGKICGKTPQILICEQNGSLLAQNFNALWCMALNECAKGEGVDYFAMLHSDIMPDDGWVDVLIEELEAKELDVLGTPVPIKDQNGLTSLALAHDSGDPFRVQARLTMTEIYQLPETFTSEDLGRPLLLNTGCWVCKFDPEWARKVRFTINDAIAFNPKTGTYFAQVEPEDWYFSRLCHELGLKIGATRKVKLNHIGKAAFGNAEAWGNMQFDSQNAAASVLPQRELAEV
jgi:hypothetical protein